MSERSVDIALAAVLAVLPLLPGGPQYFGGGSWVEAGLLALLLLRLLTPNRRPVPPARATLMGRAFLPFAIAMTGAAVLGILNNNLVDSPAFAARLAAWPAAAFSPIDQVTDALYPLRIWLTLLEGPIAFLIVTSICRRAADPRRRATFALQGAVIGLALVSAFAVFQYVTRFHLHPYWARANPNLVRAHSTLEDPNTLGSYLVLGIGVVLALARSAESPRTRKAVTAGIGILASVALLMTLSRSALIGAVAAGALVVAFGPGSIRMPRLRRLARAGIGASIALAIIWCVAHVSLPPRAAGTPANPLQLAWSTIDPRVPLGAVLKQRDLYWIGATRMARESPIAGVGLGRYPRIVTSYTDHAVVADNAQNMFLQLLAETGVVGLVTFLACLAAGALALRAAARAPGAAGVASGLAFGGLAFLITLVTGHPLLLPSCQLILASTWASGLIAASGDDGPGGTLEEPPRWWMNAMTALSVIALLVYTFAGRDTAWDGEADPFGYSSGLYAEERDPAGAFHWTGASAILSYQSRAAGARAVSMHVAAFPPAAGTVTTITIRAGDARIEVPCTDGTWHQVQLPLTTSPNAGDRVDVRIDVDRVSVPSASRLSQDTRALGAMLRAPEFVK